MSLFYSQVDFEPNVVNLGSIVLKCLSVTCKEYMIETRIKRIYADKTRIWRIKADFERVLNKNPCLIRVPIMYSLQVTLRYFNTMLPKLTTFDSKLPCEYPPILPIYISLKFLLKLPLYFSLSTNIPRILLLDR